MKIIGFLLVILGILAIVLTVLGNTTYVALLLGAAAILTGVGFVAAAWKNDGPRGGNCCRNNC